MSEQPHGLKFNGRAKRQLKRLDAPNRTRVKDALDGLREADCDPTTGANIKRLQGTLREYHRVRVGGIRVAYKVDRTPDGTPRITIVVVQIGTRDGFYGDLRRSLGL